MNLLASSKSATDPAASLGFTAFSHDLPKTPGFASDAAEREKIAGSLNSTFVAGCALVTGRRKRVCVPGRWVADA